MSMLLTTVLLCAQTDVLERWGSLLYEVETARLAEEDVAAEVKAGADEKALRGFRAKDVEPRRRRIQELAKALEVEATPAVVRERFAAAKKKHAESLEKDPAARIRWTERQIHELYAPLVTLNARGFAAVKGYQKLAEAGDGERALWKVWAAREFLPRNEATRNVIEAKLFLVEGEGLSEPFLDFLLHQHSWARRHARWEAEKGDYDWGSRTNWPVAFSMECEKTYQALLDRRARLVAGEK
ncbi:MAG TPA: hypothetical protein VF950_05040 [Planctomycetota bacterium]